MINNNNERGEYAVKTSVFVAQRVEVHRPRADCPCQSVVEIERFTVNSYLWDITILQIRGIIGGLFLHCLAIARIILRVGF